jgi:hypothetical protein
LRTLILSAKSASQNSMSDPYADACTRAVVLAA